MGEKEPSQATAPDGDLGEPKDAIPEGPDTGTESTNHEKPAEVVGTETTATANDNSIAADEQADVNRAADDDGGEVVEDNEDTVIY